MESATVTDLVEHLVRSTSLPRGLAERLVADVCDWFAEPVEQFVRRRHRELQADGNTNEQIFRRLAGELRERPFSAPALSARQLRRIVYG